MIVLGVLKDHFAFKFCRFFKWHLGNSIKDINKKIKALTGKLGSPATTTKTWVLDLNFLTGRTGRSGRSGTVFLGDILAPSFAYPFASGKTCSGSILQRKIEYHARDFPQLGKKYPPQKLTWQQKNCAIWRCISYWKWAFSNVYVSFRGVNLHCVSETIIAVMFSCHMFGRCRKMYI